MKTRILLLNLILLSLFSINCKDNVVVPSEDEVTTGKIIGTWKYPNYEIITFKSDGSFIDTSLALFTDKYETHYVLKGKYTVNNSIIYFTDVSLVYCKAADNSTVISFSTTIDPKAISFKNDQLNLESVKILEPKDNSSTLNGKWEVLSWIGYYENSSQPKYNGGQMKETYIFNKDSMTYVYQNEFLFYTSMSSGSISSKYNYNNSQLDFGYPLYFRVEYKNNKMYWYYYSLTFQNK